MDWRANLLIGFLLINELENMFSDQWITNSIEYLGIHMNQNKNELKLDQHYNIHLQARFFSPVCYELIQLLSSNFTFNKIRL